MPGEGLGGYGIAFDGYSRVETCDSVEPCTDGVGEEWGDILDLAADYTGTPRCCTAPSAGAARSARGARGRVALTDSHCHAGASELAASSAGCVKAKMLVTGTNEGDWGTVLQACSQARRGVPAFGLHPWYAHNAVEGWVDRLRDLLLQHPCALVGEVGLDKCFRVKESKKCEYQLQQEAFAAQLQLAHELGRPMSVHCVQSWGKTLEHLERAAKKGELPPALAMHSWGGPPEWVAQLRKAVEPQCPLYFGFSDAVNYRGGEKGRSERLEANLRAVADDRLLLESDLDAPEYIDQYMATICNVVAKAKGWSFQQVAEVTAQNAERYLGTRAA